MKKLLKRKKLGNLVEELEADPESFEDWKKMTEAQWKEVAGVLAGIQIYNYLNPRREGTEVLSIGYKMDVDSQGINGSFKVVLNAEYTRYMKIAATLKDDDRVSEICNQLLDINNFSYI